MPAKIYSAVMLILLICGWLLFAVKLLHRRFAPVKSVKAVVIDKHKTEVFSKYAGSGKCCRYVIVFLAEGKKRLFYVSEFSYGGYRINESGTLKYKGDRLIDFS